MAYCARGVCHITFPVHHPLQFPPCLPPCHACLVAGGEKDLMSRIALMYAGRGVPVAKWLRRRGKGAFEDLCSKKPALSIEREKPSRRVSSSIDVALTPRGSALLWSSSCSSSLRRRGMALVPCARAIASTSVHVARPSRTCGLNVPAAPPRVVQSSTREDVTVCALYSRSPAVAGRC